MKTSKTLRAALALMLTILPIVTTFSTPALAQNIRQSNVQDGRTQPDCVIQFTFTATGTSTSFDNRNKLCTVWQFAYYSTGFSAVNIALQEAPDSSGVAGSFVTWPVAQILNSIAQPLALTTSASLTAYGYFPWINVNASTLTGTGTVLATAYGWRGRSNDDVARAPGSISLVDGQKPTYGAAAIAFSAGTGATTDIFTIYGSATKTIRVTKLEISSSTATAAAYYDVTLAVRSTAASGGTPATPTTVPYNSGSAAATAVVKNWTAAPTAGTNVGAIAARRYFSALTGTAAPVTSMVFDFGARPAQAPVLVGTAQGLAVTLNGATPANAQTWNIYVEWTEE